MYDSVIFGYGMTIEVLNRVKSLSLKNYSARYLDFNVFLEDFINSTEHSVIWKEYLELLDFINDDVLLDYRQIKDDISENFSEIKFIGFERWVSRYLFSTNEVSSGIKLITYILYNFWFDKICKEVLINSNAKKYITDVASSLGQLLTSKRIYTTNFDTMFDDILDPYHLHGSFQIPFNKAKQLVMHEINGSSFEYKFLFGTSGYEKMYRIGEINKLTDHCYDLDFFYSDNLAFDHLLLIGLSFSKTEIIPKEVMGNNEDIQKYYIFNSVDGHILLRLMALKESNKLKKITYAYYSEEGKNHFKDIVSGSSLETIVKYVDSKTLL